LVQPEASGRGFWGRATLAVALALYGWSMMGVELYLLAAQPATGPARNLAVFRRVLMGRGVVGLGAAAVLAAIVLAVIAKRDRRWSVVALVLAAGWIALFVYLLPTL
jgi:hypothetical protein